MNQVWTVVLAEEVTIPTASTQAFNIVQDSDWSVAGSSERATILRVRGRWSFTNKFTTGSNDGGAVMAFIILVDSDAGDPDPSTSSSYVDEDVLWARSVEMPFVDTGTAPAPYDWDIDVKAMRKIRKGQELRMIMSNNSADSVRITGVMRALVRRGAS